MYYIIVYYRTKNGVGGGAEGVIALRYVKQTNKQETIK